MSPESTFLCIKAYGNNHSFNRHFSLRSLTFEVKVIFIRRGTNPAPLSLGDKSETFCLTVGRLGKQLLHYRGQLEEHSHPSTLKTCSSEHREHYSTSETWIMQYINRFMNVVGLCQKDNSTNGRKGDAWCIIKSHYRTVWTVPCSPYDHDSTVQFSICSSITINPVRFLLKQIH